MLTARESIIQGACNIFIIFSCRYHENEPGMEETNKDDVRFAGKKEKWENIRFIIVGCTPTNLDFTYLNVLSNSILNNSFLCFSLVFSLFYYLCVYWDVWFLFVWIFEVYFVFCFKYFRVNINWIIAINCFFPRKIIYLFSIERQRASPRYTLSN